MSAAASSNPFRRAGTHASANEELPGGRGDVSSGLRTDHNSSEDTERAHARAPSQRPAILVKKVRVQSPPPSSPEERTAYRPPTPSPLTANYHDEEDPFDGVTASGTDGQQSSTGSSGAPPNPFERTLHTMARAAPQELNEPSLPKTSRNNASGRASMDVEAFKRLLLTGSTGPATPEGLSSPAMPENAGLLRASPVSYIDEGQALTEGECSSTETSASSQSSIVAPQPESSEENLAGEVEQVARASTIPTLSSARKRPPPPSSRHGNILTSELKEPRRASVDGTSAASVAAGSKTAGRATVKAPAEAHKPLPLLPTQPGHEMDKPSVDDKDVLNNLQRASSTSRKSGPTPPAARRQSQLNPTTKLYLHDMVRSSPLEADNASIASQETTATRSSSTKAPPPPPRRPASFILSPSPAVPSASPAAASDQERASSKGVNMAPPPPPPARSSSVRKPGKAASITSVDSSVGRRSAAPPPPPRRQRASSGVSHLSVDSSQADDDHRSTAGTGDTLTDHSENAKNILASLSELQKDLDTYRVLVRRWEIQLDFKDHYSA